MIFETKKPHSNFPKSIIQNTHLTLDWLISNYGKSKKPENTLLFNFHLANQPPLKAQKMLTENMITTLRMLLQNRRKYNVKHWLEHKIKVFIKVYRFLFIGQ